MLTCQQARCVVLGVALLLAAELPAACQRGAATETSFAELVQTLSEPGGYFDTDNLISNERSYTQVVDRLMPRGGVYIGVGPEQNFNYIGRTRPSWAFIVDIRRDNMIQQLLLQTVLAQAETPYQYLQWLFSRTPPPATAEPPIGLEATVAAFGELALERPTFERNLASVLRYIESDLGLSLSSEDRGQLEEIYSAFFRDQLGLRFRSHGRPVMRRYPTYGQLMMARTPGGEYANFLARPDDYAYVRKLAIERRLIPVVGDFAGPRALKSIARFVEARSETVTTFYTSNVEFYLLRTGRFDDYVENVRALPQNEHSVFIRSYFDYGFAHPESLPGNRSAMLLQSMPDFLRNYDAGRYRTYWDVCMDYLD